MYYKLLLAVVYTSKDVKANKSEILRKFLWDTLTNGFLFYACLAFQKFASSRICTFESIFYFSRRILCFQRKKEKRKPTLFYVLTWDSLNDSMYIDEMASWITAKSIGLIRLVGLRQKLRQKFKSAYRSQSAGKIKNSNKKLKKP